MTATASPSRRWATGALLAALATLTAAGCGGRSHTDGAPSPQAHSTAPSVPPPVSTPGTTPTRTSAGSNPSACAHGDCEVAVRKATTIHFPAPGGTRATLALTDVGPNSVDIEVTVGGSRSGVGGSAPGEVCTTIVSADGSSGSCGHQSHPTRPHHRSGAVVIQAATDKSGTVLLDIVH